MEPFLSKRVRDVYRFDVAAGVNGKSKDHVVFGDLWSALRVIHVHVAIIAERVQVISADDDGHVV